MKLRRSLLGLFLACFASHAAAQTLNCGNRLIALRELAGVTPDMRYLSGKESLRTVEFNGRAYTRSIERVSVRYVEPNAMRTVPASQYGAGATSIPCDSGGAG